MKPLSKDKTHEKAAFSGQHAIHRQLNRLLYGHVQTGNAAAEENGNMITKVLIRPNPFESSITLEVTCVQSKHIIIRMTDEDDRIVKMFSWFVVKGDNVTTFNEVESLSAGLYNLDVMNLEGELIFTSELIYSPHTELQRSKSVISQPLCNP